MNKVIKKYVEQLSVDADRKKTITASVEDYISINASAPESTIKSLIESLGNRKQETVLSYSAGLNRCVHCKKEVDSILLHNKRNAYYCKSCTIVIPAPIRN